MKLVKTASGKQTIKISKKEWQSIGKTAGWLNKTAWEPAEEYTEVQKPVYVSVYEVSRNYGGPEEGGWWYDAYSLEDSKEFLNKVEAKEYAEELKRKIKGEGLNDESLSSARGMDQYPDPSGGDPMYDHSDTDIPLGFAGDPRNYVVRIEDVKGGSETTEAPHYE